MMFNKVYVIFLSILIILLIKFNIIYFRYTTIIFCLFINLSLANLEICEPPAEVENQELYFENCKLAKDLSLIFEANPNLTRLRAFNCGISHIDNNTFSNANKLSELDLSQNKIVNLEGNVFSLPIGYYLTYLNLSYNKIESLPFNVFVNLKQLSKLSLRGNRISYLPFGIFTNQKKLHTLDVSHNLITLFNPYVLLPVESLRKFLINHNNIKHINYENTRFTGLSEFTFDHNPFECSFLGDMITYLQSRSKFRNTIKIEDEIFDLPNLNGIVCFDKYYTIRIEDII